jgi:hypothetical protein
MDLMIQNLTSPMILAFVLGVVARLVKSDLSFPEGISSMLSIFLLFAIGLKGGAALQGVGWQELLLPALATIALGAAIPLWCYPALRRLAGFSSVDAAAIAAHYGSTSAVTFLAGLTFLEAAKTPVEGFMPGLVALMEVPGIVVALVLARPVGGARPALGPAVGHLLASKSMILLLGGMVIGAVSDPQGMASISAFFVDPFRGVLCLFLLELGMVAAARVGELKGRVLALVVFGLAAPLVNGIAGVGLGHLIGLSVGGATILGVLAASASYIAAPATVRISLPQANPTPAIAAALGITFPFNLAVGLPLYHALAGFLAGPAR